MITAEQEREAIVNWHRRQAAFWNDMGLNTPWYHPLLKAAIRFRMADHRHSADAIERGEHVA